MFYKLLGSRRFATKTIYLLTFYFILVANYIFLSPFNLYEREEIIIIEKDLNKILEILNVIVKDQQYYDDLTLIKDLIVKINQMLNSEINITDDFLDIFFTDLDEGVYKLKIAAIRFLFSIASKLNGRDSLEIGLKGVFALLIPHISIYPFEIQKIILNCFDTFLFWGQVHGSENVFLEQFNECDGLTQLQQLLDDESIRPQIKNIINKILNDYLLDSEETEYSNKEREEIEQFPDTNFDFQSDDDDF